MIRQSRFRQANALLVFAALSAAMTGCGKHSKPNTLYMEEMVYSKSYKAQEQGPDMTMMLMPVKGTIPRDFQPFPSDVTDVLQAGKEIKNPLAKSESVYARGQLKYNTYCLPCHGPAGEGDGTVVPKFPRPPSLQSEKIIGYQDGSLYYVISKGQNLMPSYAAQVTAEDRWAIVHYIRALQKSKNPTAEDLKSASR